MATLSDLGPPGAPAAPPTCPRCGAPLFLGACVQCPPTIAAAPPTMRDLVAAPGLAPHAWQAAAPVELFAAQRFMPIEDSPDLQRILALPRRPPLDLSSPEALALADRVTLKYRRPYDAAREAQAEQFDAYARHAEVSRRRDVDVPALRAQARRLRGCDCATIDAKVAAGKRRCMTKLEPVQAWALDEISRVGGLLGAIPVGGGKTILWVLTALALAPYGVRDPVLLVPPSLCNQLEREYLLLRQHFWVPGIYFRDGTERNMPVTGAPTVHVFPYSRLCRPDASDWLARIQPDAIIADECDKLRDPGTATTSRVMRYFANHGGTRFVGGTGSITDKSLNDYAHLCALALREGSPLPLDPDIVDHWARALDPGGGAPPGELLQLCAPGEDVHDGFRRRLTETPGVVVSTQQSVRVDLVVEPKEAPPIPERVMQALNMVRGFVRPDTMAGSEENEELVDALSVAKCAMEVAAGMFYRWIFPRGEPESVIKEWYAARKAWNSELRRKLMTRDEFLDSPLLCEHAAQRHWGDRPKDARRPEWNADAWPRWRDVRKMVEPETEVVWIDDFLARDAAQWALENRGIVWYGLVEFGRKVSQLSAEMSPTGKPLPMHGGGPEADRLINAERGDRSIIASIKSHGRGRDGLQLLFENQLIAQPPSSATMWEQLLGRLHRQGQASELVRAWIYVHTDELQRAVEQALARAKYVQSTIGASQKLLVSGRGLERWSQEE